MVDLGEFLADITKKSQHQIDQLHHFAKYLWKEKRWTPIDLQNRMLDLWDELGRDVDFKIRPLVRVDETRPVTNLIFGSGGFSTGEFQVQQYEMVKTYAPSPPVQLLSLVANKSSAHECHATQIRDRYHIPLVELDFIDWYHEHIHASEPNPINATRYWFSPNEPNAPSLSEIAHRFSVRQSLYHKELGELILRNVKYPIDIVSARGYNFQFCATLFPNQPQRLPFINDTHPADLSFIDPQTHQKLYAGWQAGSVDLMIKDAVHKSYRGSLIEVEYMNEIHQIHSLDEGALLALGHGVTPPSDLDMTAKDIQNAIKIIDDHLFCTLEPTGLILCWGITDKAIPVVYQTKNGEKIMVKQRGVMVGNKLYNGIHAWGQNIHRDLENLKQVLFSN